jgi:hypothetical protein
MKARTIICAIACALGLALTGAATAGANAGTESGALAQERYYSSYGAPERPAAAQSTEPSDDTPWLPIALSAAGALAIVTAGATQARRLRVRRRSARVAA